MAIRIGANPIGWSNDDLIEIGGQTPLETCLGEAREAGIVGMELGNKFPREPEALKAALAPYGMSCIGGWYSIELLRRSAAEEFEAAKAHRDLLKAMGTDVFIVCETSNTVHGSRGTALSKRPIMAADDWAPYGAKVTDFASRLADEGLKLCYHHHMGTIVQTGEEIDRFMAATKAPVNLLLDTGHATWGGSNPAKLAATYRDRITHVHCKDVRLDMAKAAEAADLSFLDAILGQGAELGVYTVPGDGAVDYTAVFKALKGYAGWVVLEAEQDPDKANPLAYARKGVAHLKACLAEAGLS
ncbi:myo-inosose-2 dehydratase [Lichenihabitans sp. Uapishka_5]|uniref:myo-inosose-2 dehydratase n=1 Tax=Lichenihabitans sp. Uapishka_5 TaxID=3037302 RepID=UPI0029E7E569|nr:myo-inosose-2 dehydratase [Lichenihabitans sp. Uapishka_5]MDX7952342.1 myo-inosose-2 dehydratase [Lichenihabitans sp. Uapishka_5]